MDKDAMGGPFPRGGANTDYARYFMRTRKTRGIR